MVGYESWIDRQIREAQERGEFDNLRGAGQPIPGLGGREDENWWVKGLLERENLRPPLPGSLLLRKETVEIADTVADCVTEDQVREIGQRVEGFPGVRKVVNLLHVPGAPVPVMGAEEDQAEPSPWGATS